MSKQTNLNNSRETETFILGLDNAGKYKVTLLSAYFYYCKANKIEWVPPRIKAQSAPIVIPTEERIDKIIGAGLHKWITIFSISKHGLRPDEISKITLRDIDLQRGLLTVRTSKLGAERTVKLKDYALQNLKAYVERESITQIDVPFFPSPNAMHDMWSRCRRRAYLNFRDTELLKIRAL